jgi:small-conductance mechanosensitive channel
MVEAASEAAPAAAAPPPAASADAPVEDAPPSEAAPVPPAPPASEPGPEKEAPPVEPVPVRIGGRTIYTVRAAQGEVSPAERARAAEQAIRKAVETETPDSVRVEHLEDTKVVYAGKIPLLHLTANDAKAAGDASLGVHADRVATELREVIGTEQKRSAIATTIFSFSLAALLTLAALLLFRKTSEITERVRSWVATHRENIPGIRLQSVEVVDAATIRSAVALGVEVSKWLLRLGIVYLWLLLTLSLFESTREYSQDLTGIVLTPLSSLMARIAKSLPVVVVALIALAVIAVFVRFVDLFFAGVARGETKLSWLTPDLAPPTSVLLRFAIVIAALVFAAPVVTGDAEGGFGKIGLVVLAALGLASTPVLASCLLGVVVLYGRRLRVGDFVEFGGKTGRIVAINLLEVRLEDAEGSDLRVPHLLQLLHSTRVIGPRMRTTIELSVADQSAAASETLRTAAARIGDRVRVEVVQMEAAAVRYRVSVVSTRLDARNALFFAAADALREAGVPLSGLRQPAAGQPPDGQAPAAGVA